MLAHLFVGNHRRTVTHRHSSRPETRQTRELVHKPPFPSPGCCRWHGAAGIAPGRFAGQVDRGNRPGADRAPGPLPGLDVARVRGAGSEGAPGVLKALRADPGDSDKVNAARMRERARAGCLEAFAGQVGALERMAEDETVPVRWRLRGARHGWPSTGSAWVRSAEASGPEKTRRWSRRRPTPRNRSSTTPALPGSARHGRPSFASCSRILGPHRGPAPAAPPRPPARVDRPRAGMDPRAVFPTTPPPVPPGSVRSGPGRRGGWAGRSGVDGLTLALQRSAGGCPPVYGGAPVTTDYRSPSNSPVSGARPPARGSPPPRGETRTAGQQDAGQVRSKVPDRHAPSSHHHDPIPYTLDNKYSKNTTASLYECWGGGRGVVGPFSAPAARFRDVRFSGVLGVLGGTSRSGSGDRGQARRGFRP